MAKTSPWPKSPNIRPKTRTKVTAARGVGSISLLAGMPINLTMSSKGLNRRMFIRRTGASGSRSSETMNRSPQISRRMAISFCLSLASIQPVMNMAFAENADRRMALRTSSYPLYEWYSCLSVGPISFLKLSVYLVEDIQSALQGRFTSFQAL